MEWLPSQLVARQRQGHGHDEAAKRDALLSRVAHKLGHARGLLKFFHTPSSFRPLVLAHHHLHIPCIA